MFSFSISSSLNINFRPSISYRTLIKKSSHCLTNVTHTLASLINCSPLITPSFYDINVSSLINSWLLFIFSRSIVSRIISTSSWSRFVIFLITSFSLVKVSSLFLKEFQGWLSGNVSRIFQYSTRRFSLRSLVQLRSIILIRRVLAMLLRNLNF